MNADFVLARFELHEQVAFLDPRTLGSQERDQLVVRRRNRCRALGLELAAFVERHDQTTLHHVGGRDFDAGIRRHREAPAGERDGAKHQNASEPSLLEDAHCFTSRLCCGDACSRYGYGNEPPRSASNRASSTR